MPLRSLCCCCADDAVIQRKGPQDGAPGRAHSSASSISLPYMDAVADEKDFVDPLAFQRAGSAVSDVFFDATDGEGEKSGVELVSTNKSAATAATSSEDNNTYLQANSSHNKDEEDRHLLAPEYRSDATASTSKHHRRRGGDPTMAGFPGHLTPAQLKAYQQFRAELKERRASTSVYQEMVENYSALEPESYELCRYLRSQNFNVKKVFAYMDHHAPRWKEAATQDFYPNVEDAVGAPLSVLLTQFPSLYYGFSKQGYPCCYFNAGGLSVEGIECITDCDRLANLIWYNMMHDLKYNKFPEAKQRHPDFVRLEQLTILNLKGLSRSIFTTKMYHTLQQVDAVAGVFPEMLHSVIIINAPGFFSFFWSFISRLLNAKTNELIEIYSSPEKGEKRLLELIDESDLPRDYGGKAPSTTEIILREGRVNRVPSRQIVELVHARKQPQQFEFALESVEKIEISIYTRSKAPIDFTLLNGKGEVVHKRHLQASDGDRLPACFAFEHVVDGPGKFVMQSTLGDPHGGGKHYFLVIGEVFQTGV